MCYDRANQEKTRCHRKGSNIMAATKKAIKSAVPTELDAEGKKKALATAMSQIERDFGAGAIMKLGENTKMEVQAVSTGSLSLDMALGIGGAFAQILNGRF